MRWVVLIATIIFSAAALVGLDHGPIWSRVICGISFPIFIVTGSATFAAISTRREPRCCHIGCDRRATVQIESPPFGPDDYTQMCD